MAVPRITREELKARLDSPDSSSHPIIVDVRLKYPYEHSTVTLPGAQRILPDAVSSATLPRDRDIVFYDSDPQDIVSSTAAAELLRRGYRAFVLQGGVSEWMNAKLPVATKSAPQPAAPAAKAAPAAGAAPAAKPTPGATTAPKPAASSAAAAPKPTGPASVEGPATPATESKE
ncbi:MAG TPA: rhodanese-like domain-containing protein [Vicinamibacterales bacterium]|nr:rhodanese-like domain-containing protein [Vicinamibacterales bacterium]